jgi:hypothetical protein
MKATFGITVPVLGLSVLVVLAAALTPGDVSAMQRAIISYYNFIPQYGAPCNPCLQGPIVSFPRTLG